MVHVANSAATLAVPESHFDAVRPGLSLYGIYPATEKPIPLKTGPYMESAYRLDKHYSEGEGVSYGLTYKAPYQTRVAMVQIGYGDGYPRLLSGIGEVLINGTAPSDNRTGLHGRECGAAGTFR